MNLSPGARIGSFDVAEQIGAGGMGEVYRAHDHRLGRDVALKVLPASVAADADRLARLQREARTLAALNHPHIAQLYGLEEGGGLTALVMELVPGATLADRIARGPIPLDEALPIARQLAEALEAAHEQGIIHRDLKPANIKVREDGTVKVLDFGLARGVDTAGALDSSRLPTITSPAMMTSAGVVLGTAAYMSPEQAKGRPVDRRADIWAFGVVLAEMLAGKTVFAGDTVTETMASVMKDEPAIPDAPPAIRQLIRRCLERDPRRRLRDIGEARIVLEDPTSLAREPLAPAEARLRTSRRTWGGVAAALAATALAAGTSVWALRPGAVAPDLPLRKFMVPIRGLQAGVARAPQISPDGTRLVYVANGRLVLRDLAALESRELASDNDPRYFTWSPDSSEVAYLSGDRLMRVPVAGGAPAVVTVLRQNLGNGVGMSWGPDGRIVLTTAMPGTGIQQVSASGGDLTTLISPESPTEQDFHEVTLLPGGRGLVYALDRGAGVVDEIFVFAEGARKRVLRLEGEALRMPIYSATGHILYERTSNTAGIWALPFSLSLLEATGEPFLVASQGALPSLSREGTLLLLPQAPPFPSELIVVDAAGRVERTIGQPHSGLTTPRLSHDGRRVAVSASANARMDVWLFDVQRGSRTRFTFGDGDEVAGAWSPADDRIFFLQRVPPAQNRTIAVQAADGTGQATEAVASRNSSALDVSRDGRFLIYSDSGRDPSKTGQDLWYVALDGQRTRTLFVEAPTAQGEPRFAPDGRFVAYGSNESGGSEVYLKPFPSGDGKWQVSVNGGVAPRWSARGDRLFFIELGNDPKMMEVEISTTPTLTIGTPRALFAASTLGRPLGGAGWDVFPDGKRFLVIGQVPTQQPETPAITLVQNWFAEFRNRQTDP